MKRLSQAQGDLTISIQGSRSGLRDSDRRSLMRLLFAATAVSLLTFGLLQILNGRIWLAAIEFVSSVVVLYGYLRMKTTTHLQGWVYGYLIALFSFFLGIMLVPDASMAAFVWILMMPVLAYLLLGKKDGPLVCIPFMAAGFVCYFLYLGSLNDAQVIIDLLNLALSGSLMLVFMHLYERRREHAELKLVSLAQTDALTGLGNRSSFQSSLERTLKESSRTNVPFALVVMDIDHFKMVNDTLGHDAGDWVLCHISQLLSQRLRTTDTVGRLGGEEFGLILRNTGSPDAFHLMDELRLRVADAKVRYGETDVSVTASFGIAYWPEDGRQAHELYRTADRRLYKSKNAGRNKVAASDWVEKRKEAALG